VICVIELGAGALTAAVDPSLGARLSSLRVTGLELLVGRDESRDDPLLWGCYPMVPFAGRTRGGRFGFRGETYELRRNHGPHAIHGTGFDRPWDVERYEGGYARLCTDLGPEWPFPGHAVHEISARGDGLDLRLEVHADRGAFPATAGWHPWWRRELGAGHPLEVTVPARRWYPRGTDGLPLGHVEQPPFTGRFDDCFTALTWPVRLRWPGALSVELVATADHLVLFDEPAHAICVEPQSGPPDGLNLGIASIVRPGAPLVVETGISWRPDLADPRDAPATIIERRLPSQLSPDTRRLDTDRRALR
jgi:aldose 1-epimerase